jgi:hypothetical protein
MAITPSRSFSARLARSIAWISTFGPEHVNRAGELIGAHRLADERGERRNATAT